MTRNEIIEGLLTDVQEGVKSIKTSEDFIKYLDFLSMFRRYSANNAMLIMLQKPFATYVTAYSKWEKVNRYPKKGTAIQILAPLFGKDKDSDSDEKKLYGFKYVNVFDYSDTTGEEVPLMNTTIDVFEDTDFYMDKLIALAPNGVVFEDLDMMNLRGYYTREDHSIHINDNYPKNEQLRTLIHELAHSLLHDTDEKGKMPKGLKELQAESVAYCIARLLDWDVSNYSFQYIATYTNSEDEETIATALEQVSKTVRKISNELIGVDNGVPVLEESTN